MQKILSSTLINTPRYPELEALTKWLFLNQNSVRINHPFQIFDDPIKGYGLKALAKIPANEEIFCVSTTKCITGLEIVDCSPTKAFEVMKISDRIADKFHKNNSSQNVYTRNIIKIALQMYVHLNDPTLSLHHYSNFLNKTKHTSPIFWNEATLRQIYSNTLINTIANTRNYIYSLQGALQDHQVFAISFPELASTISIIRSRNLNFTPSNPKEYTKDYVCMLCPVVDLMNHDFENNSYIQGKYIHMDSESYVSVKSSKEIESGQELLINYGDYGNHDYLMKFGFLVPNNKFNEFNLPLDFSDHIELSGQQFELKQKILKTAPTDVTLDAIKLENYRINENILKMLRIYFLTNEDVLTKPEIAGYLWKNFKDEISTENEKKMCEFLIKILTSEIKKYKEAKSKRVTNEDITKADQNTRNMLILCENEIEILEKNLGFFERKLGTLLSL